MHGYKKNTNMHISLKYKLKNVFAILQHKQLMFLIA